MSYGKDVIAEVWQKNHGPGHRILTLGLKRFMENDRTLVTYGIKRVCTTLSCVVPWNAAEIKFICPCYGLQYINQGRVVRGPAPLSLALAHGDLDGWKVVFVPREETHFRTGEAPWWA